MYEGYWRIRRKPFENTPDPFFFYDSLKHEEALSRLLYAVKERKGGTILTGEPGCGKTLLSRVLLRELDSRDYQFAVIFNPRLSPLHLLQEIVSQLDSTAECSSKLKLFRAFHAIVRRNSEQGRTTVIVVDEAQTITHKNCFEELRLLMNFQSEDNFLLTLVLIGQPELKQKINNLPQFKQRFTVRYHIRALTRGETREYVLHRLQAVGAGEHIFPDDACEEVYRYSCGVPRRINNICDMALLVGAAQESREISRNIIRDVAEDLEEVPV